MTYAHYWPPSLKLDTPMRTLRMPVGQSTVSSEGWCMGSVFGTSLSRELRWVRSCAASVSTPTVQVRAPQIRVRFGVVRQSWHGGNRMRRRDRGPVTNGRRTDDSPEKPRADRGYAA